MPQTLQDDQSNQGAEDAVQPAGGTNAPDVRDISKGIVAIAFRNPQRRAFGRISGYSKSISYCPLFCKMSRPVMQAIRKHFFFIIIAAFFLLFLLLYSPLKNFTTTLISLYGLFGLFFLVVVMDTIIQPISPDILVFSSTFGGASLLWASLVGGIASCVAGSIGYAIGRALGEDGFRRCTVTSILRKGRNFSVSTGYTPLLSVQCRPYLTVLFAGQQEYTACLILSSYLPASSPGCRVFSSWD